MHVFSELLKIPEVIQIHCAILFHSLLFDDPVISYLACIIFGFLKRRWQGGDDALTLLSCSYPAALVWEFNLQSPFMANLCEKKGKLAMR